MHVLYLIDSLIAGGAERSLAALAPHYRRLGVDLDVGYFFERDNVWLPSLDAAGADVFSLAGHGGRGARARRAGHLIRQRRPDVVHTTLFEADLAGRVGSLGTHVPVVGSLVNVAYGPEQLADPAIKAWKLRLAQLLDAATARRVTRFHAVSSSIADVMARRLRIASDRIDVIPRGRDPEELGRRTQERRNAARAALGVRHDVLLVLAVGRHEYQKGFDVLLRAFASLREERTNARLVLAGRTGGATPNLVSMIDALGLEESAELLGFRSDVPDLMCAADIFVSSSRWEGSPGGVLEAMALELPIVTTDIPAVHEVLAPGCAAGVVPVDDPERLAGAMHTALDAAGSGDATAAARARFLADFTIDAIARRMVELYERVMTSRR